MRAAVVAIVCLFAALNGGPALAQTISSSEPAAIAKLLSDRGQQVIVTVDEFDDPFIETSVDNVDYSIWFYGCTAHRDCTSISLRAHRASAGQATIEAMNIWNTDQRWTKLYTPERNSAVLEMDLFFGDSAMGDILFAGYVDIWDRSLAQFVRYIDEGDYAFIE